VHLRRSTALPLLCCALIACGDTSAPTINPVDYLLAEMDGSWSASAASYMALSYTPRPPSRAAAGTCVLNATTHLFVCPARSDLGLTFNLSYELLDAADAPMNSYDKNTTAAVRTITDVSGTLTFTGSTSTLTEGVVSHGDRVLTGIIGNTPTVNGTESATFTYAVNGGSPSTSWSESAISGFKVQPYGSPTPYPTGVISTKYYYTTAPAPGVVPEGTFTLTFDGSQFAKMVWTFSTLVQTCTFDLKGINDPVCTP